MKPQDIVAIRQETYDAEVVARVVERYGISVRSARNILQGATWAHIEPAGKPLPPQRRGRRISKETIDAIAEELNNPYWGIQTILAEKYGVSRNTVQRIQSEITNQ